MHLRPSNGASVSNTPPRCAASAGPAARLVVVADPQQASSGLPNPYTRTHAGLGRDPYAPPRRTFPGRRRRSNCGAEQAPRSRRRDGRLGRPGGASYASPGDGRFARANAGVSAPAARASEARPRRACRSTRAARSLSMRERAVSGRRRVALGARELLSSAARVGASSGSASAVGCRRRRTHSGRACTLCRPPRTATTRRTSPGVAGSRKSGDGRHRAALALRPRVTGWASGSRRRSISRAWVLPGFPSSCCWSANGLLMRSVRPAMSVFGPGQLGLRSGGARVRAPGSGCAVCAARLDAFE